eukprot:3308303-Prymnesium_polylepis.1
MSHLPTVRVCVTFCPLNWSRSHELSVLSCCVVLSTTQEQTGNCARLVSSDTAAHVRTPLFSTGARTRITPKTGVAVCRVFWLACRAP